MTDRDILRIRNLRIAIRNATSITIMGTTWKGWIVDSITCWLRTSGYPSFRTDSDMLDACRHCPDSDIIFHN